MRRAERSLLYGIPFAVYIKALLILSLLMGVGEYRLCRVLSGLMPAGTEAFHIEQGRSKAGYENKNMPVCIREKGQEKPDVLYGEGKPTPDADSTGQQKKTRNHPFQHVIMKAARRHEVEPEIIKAIIMAESGFNPRAVSRSGARGLMQLMPRTAKYLGVMDSFDPQHNIEGGVRYFRTLLDRFNYDIELALAAYNAGSRNVLRYGGVPPFKETRFYIRKVLKFYEAYKDDTEKTHGGPAYLS